MNSFDLRRKLTAPFRGELVGPAWLPHVGRLVLGVPWAMVALLAFPFVGRPSDLDRNRLRAAQADLQSEQRIVVDPSTPNDGTGRLIAVTRYAPGLALLCWLYETSAGREMLTAGLQSFGRVVDAFCHASLLSYPGDGRR